MIIESWNAKIFFFGVVQSIVTLTEDLLIS